MTRVRRIFTDFFIRVDPYNPCYLCSIQKVQGSRFQVSGGEGSNVSGFRFHVSDVQGEKRSEDKGVRSSGNDDTLNLDPVSRTPDRGSGIGDSASDCYLAYNHKLGFLFKKKPAFAVPLSPLAFQYKDKLFTLSLRPILGVAWMTNENSAEYHRWWGGSMFGYVGKNFGFYANIRDNDASTAMAKPAYFTLEQGQVYKGMENGGVNYSFGEDIGSGRGFGFRRTLPAADGNGEGGAESGEDLIGEEMTVAV